jgi:hypothetical protein
MKKEVTLMTKKAHFGPAKAGEPLWDLGMLSEAPRHSNRGGNTPPVGSAINLPCWREMLKPC